MNRIVERFDCLKQQGRKGFVVYIGAGDPDLEATRQLALAFDQAGVDVVELGIPFSDPLADGLVNQLAAQRGLESRTTPARVLETVQAIRKDSQVPVVLYVYFNLLHRYGFKKFIHDAARAGVDGFLVLDLPPEESEDYEAMMRDAGLCVIYLVAPTTPALASNSLSNAAPVSFITFPAKASPACNRRSIAGDRPNPRAHRFAHRRRLRHFQSRTGIALAASAEAIVVGSAVVNRIAEHGKSKDLVPRVAEFVKSLVDAVKK